MIETLKEMASVLFWNRKICILLDYLDPMLHSNTYIYYN